MKKSIYYICAATLLLSVSCSKSDNEQASANSVGYLSTEFASKIDSSLVQTKAAPLEDMFWIRVKNTTTGSYVYQSTRDRIADILELKIGTYNVEADYPDVKEDAAFAQPHYWGEIKDVVIIKEQITKISEISTSIQNMKVEVAFGNHIKEHFSEYSATVSNDKGSLVFDQYTDQAGYYTLSVLKVKFEGRRKEDNSLLQKDFGVVVTTIGKAFSHKIVIDSKFSYTTKSVIYPVEKHENNEFTYTLNVD
ncbi:MAG: DUF4493 domain-containing protein [Rikenellaceae bacterium]